MNWPAVVQLTVTYDRAGRTVQIQGPVDDLDLCCVILTRARLAIDKEMSRPKTALALPEKGF